MSDFTKPDWHAPHRSVWLSVVKPLLPSRPIRWLEIGSLEGRSAAWTLDHMLRSGDELVCVDIFSGAGYESRFDESVCGRAKKVKSRSDDYLRNAKGKFWAAYIDGSHDAPDVLLDAVLTWRLLEVGGIIIFDDYLFHHQPNIPLRVSPGVAIDGFLNSYCTQLSVLHKSRQVIVQRRR